MSDKKDAVEFTFDKLEQYFEAAKQVIEQYGGDVAELGLNALRVEALSHLAIGFFIIALAYPGFLLFKKLSKMEAAASYSGKDNSATLVGATIFGVLAFLGVFFSWADIWNWVGLFYPELYAVHKFIL